VGGYVYIMASKKNGTLYVGVTNNIIRRSTEHREGKVAGFTKKHRVKLLVYYECYDRIEDAIQREKCVKEWQREWKLKLIEGMNPEWRDLYEDVVKQ